MKSHPTRVRGLKLLTKGVKPSLSRVAPYAGAWIEIKKLLNSYKPDEVAPYAGAWIEIIDQGREAIIITGRTLRGCVD